MTREKDDPEKRNLLMEQKEEKKRRQYSVSRTKIDRRSCESISSEHRKRGNPYKSSSTEQRAEFKVPPRSPISPFQDEKKDSWWCWSKDNDGKSGKAAKGNDDTCSCVSCALKKIVSSEYACVGCLLCLFTISIIVAFLVVCKSVPSFTNQDVDIDTTKKGHTETTSTMNNMVTKDSDRLKRRIDMLNDNHLKNSLLDFDLYNNKEKSAYDEDLRHVRFSGASGVDFGPSFRALNSLDEGDTKLSEEMDWSGVLGTEKNTDMQSSEKLRDFYKKLVQTDAKIKNLKKFNTEELRYMENEDNLLNTPDRYKRSLNHYNHPRRYHVVRRSANNKNSKFKEDKTRLTNNTRLKRFGNDSDEPTGFVIEKKKLLVQYQPNKFKKKVPVKKCSHAPKDTHHHEHQLKHPFYKNTQRLDELLDKFLNKNLPEIISDPFGLDMLFKHEKNKCKHPMPIDNNINYISQTNKEQVLKDQIPKPKVKTKIIGEKKQETTKDQHELLKILRPESTQRTEKDFYRHEVQIIGKEHQKIVTNSPNDFEVLLSVSTIMNPDTIKKTARIPPALLIDRVPNIRRLMQIEGEDDGSLGYEDLKEVFKTDDVENHDDMDKTRDRKKRKYDEQALPPEKYTKYNPPGGVHNPNWKGPMPLYPDELNSMIRHAALNANKVHLPTNLSDIQLDIPERKERDVSDVEYVEDYLNNKYDKLVEMAQAYSDYGVLDGKKESRNEKNSASDTATEHRVKLAATEDVFKPGLLDKLIKGRRAGVAATESNRPTRDLNNILNDLEQTGSIPSSFFYTKPHSSSEGIRFEIVPTTRSREDEDLAVMKLLGKHVKISSPPFTLREPMTPKSHTVHSTLISAYPDMQLVFSTKENTVQNAVKCDTSKKLFKSDDESAEKENSLIFALGKGKRNLLSTDFKSTSNVPIDVETTEQFDAYIDVKDETEVGKDYIQKLNVSSYNATKQHKNKQKNDHNIDSLRNFIVSVSIQPSDIVSPIPPLQAAFEKSKAVVKTTIVNESLVIINKTEMKVDNIFGENFEGKLTLTVNNPDFDTEKIDIKFGIPLVINFNEEPMMMNDSMGFNQNYTKLLLDQNFFHLKLNETELENFTVPEEAYGNITKRKRYKRKCNLLGKRQFINATAPIVEKPPNITEPSNNSINLNSTIKNNRSTNKTNSDMMLSDIFTLISNWFRALEGVKVDKPKDKSKLNLTEKLTNVTNSSEVQNHKDTAYPNHDLGMTENKGHRSRILLSVDNLDNVTDDKTEAKEVNVTRVKREDLVDNGGNVYNTTTPISHTKTSTKHRKQSTKGKHTSSTKKGLRPKYQNKSTKKQKKPKKPLKTKQTAIFKRNADDSNLIFWNDIYDDEYGIQTDKLDNSIRDKHSVSENDFIKRSGRWVHDKIKKFAENLKINPHIEDMEIKERVPRSVTDTEKATYPKSILERIPNRIKRKGSVDKDEEAYESDHASIFSALSANMNDVCKKAARAVQQTRNIEVREDSKQGTIATSLMQQLVRLLTELVDYQVQQRTCTKLPADLQSFLEWLTYPDNYTMENQAEGYKAPTPPYQDEYFTEDIGTAIVEEPRSTDRLDYFTQADKQVQNIDVRSQYIDCLHSVQELMDQYEIMNDEEKSKMTGVRSYLENQMHNLNKEIAGYDLFTLFEKRSQMRLKRDLHARLSKGHPLKRKKRRLSKFIRNFGKKHTRTTASYYDGMQVTDRKKKIVKADDNNSVDNKRDPSFHDKTSSGVKRNLKDVYYKAVAEAKKYATAKTISRKSDMTSFGTTPPAAHT